MTLLSLVKMLHLLGVIMGFGGAIFADVTILRGAILNPVRRQTIAMARSLSYLVFGGLGILWASGIALVCIHVSTDSHALLNEKLWAKIAIVAILTVNGIIVHQVALAHIAQREGQRLFNANHRGEIAKLTFIAAVSSTSWIVPFILGVATEFNFTVGVGEILGCYAWLILVAWVTMFLLASALLFETPSSAHFAKHPPHTHAPQTIHSSALSEHPAEVNSPNAGRLPESPGDNTYRGITATVGMSRTQDQLRSLRELNARARTGSASHAHRPNELKF